MQKYNILSVFLPTAVSIRIDNEHEKIYVECLAAGGLSVKFDIKTGVYVTLPTDVDNPIGLCGNNDGDPTS